MSYERIRAYSLTGSGDKRSVYAGHGIPPFVGNLMQDPVASLIGRNASQMEDEIKLVTGDRYRFNGVPVPALLSLGKAVGAARVIVGHDPGLTFAQGRRVFATADDWVYATGDNEIEPERILGKPRNLDVVLEDVQYGDHLHSAFGVADVNFDYPTGKTTIFPSMITTFIGRRNYESNQRAADPNVAGGIDIIKAVKERLITFLGSYSIRAEMFQPMTLEEAEQAVRGEKPLESQSVFERKLDLSELGLTHPMFDRYLRQALMDIPAVTHR